MKIQQVRDHAMSLGAVTEEPHHQYGSFRVGGKIFVTVPPGAEVIHVFVGETHREEALTLYPDFIEKLLWGGKVVGVRVRLAAATPAVVRALVSRAYESRVAKGVGPKAAATRPAVR